MYCSKCGTQNPEGSLFCKQCGTALTPPVTAAPPVAATAPATVYVQAAPGKTKRTSGLAIASLVLGILGISILAIIFGGIAINQTGKNKNLSGRGMAIAGLVLGILGFIATIVWVILLIAVASVGSIAF